MLKYIIFKVKRSKINLYRGKTPNFFKDITGCTLVAKYYPSAIHIKVIRGKSNSVTEVNGNGS